MKRIYKFIKDNKGICLVDGNEMYFELQEHRINGKFVADKEAQFKVVKTNKGYEVYEWDCLDIEVRTYQEALRRISILGMI